MSYDYLRSRPSKSGQSIFEKLGVSFHDVASLPISYLNLSKPTADMLSSQHTRVDDEIVHRFTTMGDLVKCGYVEMLKIAESKVYPMHASEILYEIELSLARYALKLRGTDFTVYDIRVDDLSLGDGTKEFIKRNMRAKTIGDLYVIGASRFKQYFEDVKNGKKMQQDALNAMMEFGTSPERVYNKDDMEESLSALEPQDMEDEEEEEVGQAQYLFKSIKRSLEAEKQKKSEKEDMKEQPAVVEKKSTNSTEPQVGGLRATVTYKTITETPSGF